MKKIYSILADYDGDCPSEILSSYKTHEEAKDGLKKAARTFYLNCILDGNDEDFNDEKFEEFFLKGVNNDGTEFTNNEYYDSLTYKIEESNL